eukprot:scaffold6939_cov69-Phaeocystis_antarctica.AAC.4
MPLAQQLAQPSSQQPTGYISMVTPSNAFASPLYSTTPMTVGCCAAGRHATHQPMVFVWRRLHGVCRGVAGACGQQAKRGGSAHLDRFGIAHTAVLMSKTTLRRSALKSSQKQTASRLCWLRRPCCPL